MSDETKEYEEDLKKRVEGCNADLIPLLGKWELGLGSRAFLTPDGRISSQPAWVDARKRKQEESAGQEAPKTELSEA